MMKWTECSKQSKRNNSTSLESLWFCIKRNEIPRIYKKGAHSQNEFYKALRENGYYPHGIKMIKTPVPGQPGLTDIKYSLYKKKSDGTFTTELTTSFTKPVYDPKKISNDKIYQLDQQAMKQGSVFSDGRIEGVTSNGMRFIGHIKNVEISNFYPVYKSKAKGR